MALDFAARFVHAGADSARAAFNDVLELLPDPEMQNPPKGRVA